MKVCSRCGEDTEYRLYVELEREPPNDSFAVGVCPDCTAELTEEVTRHAA